MPTYLRRNVGNKEENIETQRAYNKFDDFTEEFIEGALSDIFDSNIVNNLSSSNIDTWFSNPEDYWKEISNQMGYMYYTDGNIHQLYTLYETLPSFNFSIKVFDNSKKGYEKNTSIIQKTMYQIRYKELARDIIRHLNFRGWCVCCWLGDKKNPSLYIFDNEYVFPAYRQDGELVAMMDLAWFDEMEDDERERMFDMLKQIVSESDYNKYQNNSEEFQHIMLPIERTCCLRINTIMRNQRLGMPNGTSYLYDYVHKQTLKNLETSIANKAIKNVALLTIGNETNSYIDIGKNMRNNIVSSVKRALSTNTNPTAIPLVTKPEFVGLEFSKIDGLEGLGNDKFENIDKDIQVALGFPEAIATGNGGNSATLKLALAQLYRNVAVLVELVEYVFNKMIPIVLSKSYADNLYIEFEKIQPLETNDVLDTLKTLHAEGFAVKPILDMLPNIESTEYIERSIYEHETMKLYDTIVPPATSYTTSQTSDKEDVGRPSVEDGEGSEETILSKDGEKQEEA